MKKYNLSKIMKRAWELVKAAAMTISEALKKAWREAKSMKEKFEKSVQMLKSGCEGNEDVASNWFTFSLWEKGSTKRIYVNDYKRRSMGYIDVVTKTVHTDYSDNSEVCREIARFIEKYEF